MTDRVSIDDLDKYEALTRRALGKARIAAPDGSHLRRLADDFRAMTVAYIEDAVHFRAKGELVRAYGALYYAHAWLDAGARAGLFDVGGDDALFTLAE